MTLVPALDLRPKDDAPQHVPANIEAEQAVLGALLYDNGAFERIPDGFSAAYFFEPFHGRIFEAIEAKIRKGVLADPILLAQEFRSDPGFQDLGGVRYLADLVDRAPPASNAGEYAAAVHALYLDRMHIAIAQGAIKATLDGEGDARERIEVTEGALFALAENRAAQGFRPFTDYVTGAVTMAAEAHSRDGGLAGLSTGLIDLDQKTGGLHPSDLIIIAARPSMGKSALAANIGFSVAREYAYETQPDGSKKTVRGGVCAFFSLEMSGDQLAMRVVAERAGVSGDRMRKGEITASEFGQVRDAAIEVQDAPFYIDETGAITLAKLAARARRLRRTVGLDLLIVDYLQLMDAGLPASASMVQRVGVISAGLKAIAKELHVPVIALSQLSREVEKREDKRPQLSDLRDSGTIEQDADMVMFIYREAYYLSRLEPKAGTQEHFDWQAQMDEVQGQAEIIIGKQRHGPIGTVRVSFDESLTKFGNLARDSARYGYARNPAGND
jgi:replicative DNA helicase